jgi:cell division protein ZapA
MPHVNVSINGRQYRMACEAGQEDRLLSLADNLERRVGALRGKFGEIGDSRLTVMAALMIADELADSEQRVRRLEEELRAMQDARVATSDRQRATHAAIVAAFNSASERIDRLTHALNRTAGSGVAIG